MAPVHAPKPKGPKIRAPKARPYNWMAPRNPAALSKQAIDTISKAYGPAFSELDSQSARAQAIADKRAADDKYYQTWLDTQARALQSHADAAHASLATLEQSLHDTQNSLYSHQGSDLTSAANARAGNVSDNTQSNAFGSELNSNQQNNAGLLNSALQQGTSEMESQNAHMTGAVANNSNVMQAARQKQLSDLQSTLTNIATARTKLNLSRTSDIAKEIARLQGVEISKAQSNRDFGAATEKLGIQQANVQSEIQTRAANVKLRAAGLNQQRLNQDRNYQLNVQKYNSQVAKDIYQRDHGLGPYRVGKGGKGKPPLSQSSQNAIYNKISAVRGQLQELLSAGYSPNQAWHLLHTGGYVSTPAGANGKPGKKFYKAIGDDGLLNAAYNTRTGGPGLTSGDIRYLQHLGLTHIHGRLTIRPNPGPGIGNFRT